MEATSRPLARPIVEGAPAQRRPWAFLSHDFETRRDCATTCGARGTVDAGEPGARPRIAPPKVLSTMNLIQHAPPRFFLLPIPSPGSDTGRRGLFSLRA